MIKLCRNLSYKPKYGNDQDSIMLRHLFSMVTTILVCLAALSFSAYAYFAHSVTSGLNMIRSTSFSTTVTIKNSTDTIVTQGDIRSYHFEPGRYTVTVTTNSGVTGTGFCIVDIEGVKYYTQQLGRDVAAQNQERTEISFQLDVQMATTIGFESRWGTNVYYNNSDANGEFYITNTDPNKVIVVGTAQVITEDAEEATPQEPLPEAAEPENAVPDVDAPAADDTEIIHIVQSGETLTLIAEKYSTTYPVLAAYNNIENPNIILPGQEIRIPPKTNE